MATSGILVAASCNVPCYLPPQAVILVAVCTKRISQEWHPLLASDRDWLSVHHVSHGPLQHPTHGGSRCRLHPPQSLLLLRKSPLEGSGAGVYLRLLVCYINTQNRPRIVGFLFGFSLASSLAAYHLLDEYQRASAALQASVDELKISTEKGRRIPTLH